MADITIIHRIEAPELAAALNNLADAIKNHPVAVPAVQESAKPKKTTSKTTNPAPAQEAPVEAPVNPPVAPVTDPVNGATPVTTTAPIAAAPTPVPVSDPAPVTAATSEPVPTPAYVDKVFTFEDITAAGSQLLEQGKMPQLMDLLKGYGVQAVTQLKPEQYADVAAGLRGLGASI